MLLDSPQKLQTTKHTERPVGARGSIAICLVLMTERGNSVNVTPEKSPAPYTRNLARSSLLAAHRIHYWVITAM